MRSWIARMLLLRSRPEGRLLAATFIAALAVFGFLKLAAEIAEGDLETLDRTLLELGREHVVMAPDSVMANITMNLTALGSYAVLTLLVTIVVGIMLVNRQPVRALWVVGTTSGGGLLTVLLKAAFVRERPGVVEPIVNATGWSFPSGHALASAVVYLTLGALLASYVTNNRMKRYVLAVAMLLTGIVGSTRVLLAVHYPSDVVAGWMAGLAWALGSWLAFELLAMRRRRQRRLSSAESA